MSHNVTLKTEVRDLQVAESAARRIGWTLEHVPVWQNKYGTGKEYRNALLIHNEKGHLAGVITSEGEVLHDSFAGYMAPPDQFLREYALRSLETTALDEGGWLAENQEQPDGSLIVTVALP